MWSKGFKRHFSLQLDFLCAKWSIWSFTQVLWWSLLQRTTLRCRNVSSVRLIETCGWAVSQKHRNTPNTNFPAGFLSSDCPCCWFTFMKVVSAETWLAAVVGGAVPPLVGVQVRRTRRFRSEFSQKLQWGRFFLVLSSWWETGSQSDEPKTTKEDRTRNKEEVKRGWRSEHETSGLCLCLPAGFIHRFVL